MCSGWESWRWGRQEKRSYCARGETRAKKVPHVKDLPNQSPLHFLFWEGFSWRWPWFEPHKKTLITSIEETILKITFFILLFVQKKNHSKLIANQIFNFLFLFSKTRSSLKRGQLRDERLNYKPQIRFWDEELWLRAQTLMRACESATWTSSRGL